MSSFKSVDVSIWDLLSSNEYINVEKSLGLLNLIVLMVAFANSPDPTMLILIRDNACLNPFSPVKETIPLEAL